MSLERPYNLLRERIKLNGNAVYLRYHQYYNEFITRLFFYNTDRELAGFLSEEDALKFFRELNEYGIKLVIREKKNTKQLNNETEVYYNEFRERIESKKRQIGSCKI